MKDRLQLTANIKAAGCAAKISSLELAELISALPLLKSPQLLAGMDNFEDAAVYKITEDIAVIQTTDFFPPVLDDPYLYGRIAAGNALSDIYAMGGKPVLALNILCFPICDYPLEIVKEILSGGADTVMEAGACLAGGHSIAAGEPVYGLCVTGLVRPDCLLRNSGAQSGDVVVLCKPIGTGIALLGLKGRQLSGSAEAQLLNNLTSLNKSSLDQALKYSIHASTDVTGFGLIGHLHEMAYASSLTFMLDTGSVPLLPEALGLASQGFVPAACYSNRKAYQPDIIYKYEVAEALMDLLFDPQTNGGLLFALNETDAGQLLADLQGSGINAAIIGKFKDGPPGVVELYKSINL